MSRAVRLAVGGLLAVAVTVGTAALSRVSWTPHSGDRALLRLSWRARSERVESCRQLSAEEQARQPAHMRQSEVCEGRLLPYVLRVELDGRVLVHDTVRASGAREDRPLYVFRELPVAPGPRRLAVSFTRVPARGEHDGEDDDDDDDDDDEHDGREDDDEEDARSRAAAPARLALAASPTLMAREVYLVTYDEDRRVLVGRRPPPQSSARRGEPSTPP